MNDKFNDDEICNDLNELTEMMINHGVKNETIRDNYIKAHHIINDDKYKTILCSISGGADSDIVLDICKRVDKDKKAKYVWFDTGLEYQATKDHLKYLEQKYDIEIERHKAIKPIPSCCKEYGIPFLSKYVSENIGRLMKHGFQWEDDTYENLIKKYPKCKSSIGWWTNYYDHSEIYGNKISQFSIRRNKYLKEFLIQNPPDFDISSECCKYAKKKVAQKVVKESQCDLNIVGVRKAEGGIRSIEKTCYRVRDDEVDLYKPIFWYSDNDKVQYNNAFNIVNSDCYVRYDMKRTGCVGCPYARNFEEELSITKAYEPKLYQACMNIFGKSYEYTRKYREFQKMMKEKEKEEN